MPANATRRKTTRQPESSGRLAGPLLTGIKTGTGIMVTSASERTAIANDRLSGPLLTSIEPGTGITVTTR